MSRRDTHRGRPVSSAGFTLIEILLAMLIFMAGVSGIYSLLSTALGMQRAGLELSESSRLLDQISWQLEQELSQGLHWDEEREAWEDISVQPLGEGLYYSCSFSSEIGNEREGSLLAVITVAGSEAGLGAAESVSYLLTPGHTAAAAVRALRQRNTQP
ncbi:MAG: type II secretory pathway pseudopilin PulG [Pseudohongiellaceae bacterium]|jgi:type II secretory pathway pseudopilin PulG